MVFRTEKAALFLTLVVPLAAGELRFEVRHDHWRKSGAGELVVSERGIEFTEPKQPKHSRRWEYGEIQQIQIGPSRIRVLTYEDVRRRLGADREFEFIATKDNFTPAYQMLKDRLDQRLVAALTDADVKPDWEVPAKLTERFGGVNGVLKFAPDRIVFSTDRPERSRTWRWRVP